MITFNSRNAATYRPKTEFITSESTTHGSGLNDAPWIQSSLAQVVLSGTGRIIDDTYVVVRGGIQQRDLELESEFKQWEMASDQDFMAFEAKLDDDGTE